MGTEPGFVSDAHAMKWTSYTKAVIGVEAQPSVTTDCCNFTNYIQGCGSFPCTDDFGCVEYKLIAAFSLQLVLKIFIPFTHAQKKAINDLDSNACRF